MTLLQKRDLQREWHFTAEQIEKLERYFAATELLVQCLKVATVTDRQAILAGILLPPMSVAPATPSPAPQAPPTKPWWKFW